MIKTLKGNNVNLRTHETVFTRKITFASNEKFYM